MYSPSATFEVAFSSIALFETEQRFIRPNRFCSIIGLQIAAVLILFGALAKQENNISLHEDMENIIEVSYFKSYFKIVRKCNIWDMIQTIIKSLRQCIYLGQKLSRALQ